MISPQEQQRILIDVARRFPSVRLLELPCEVRGTHSMFPVYNSENGALQAALIALFFVGQFPSDKASEFAPELNAHQAIEWPKGRAVCVKWSLGIDAEPLEKLLIDAASSIAG